MSTIGDIIFVSLGIVDSLNIIADKTFADNDSNYVQCATIALYAQSSKHDVDSLRQNALRRRAARLSVSWHYRSREKR